MTNITKTYDIASGELRLEFYYDETIAELSDLFEAVELGNHSFGFDDNSNNRGISIYPSNINLTLDDFNEDNYKALRAFIENYNGEYPFNFMSVLYLDAYLNNALIFRGSLDTLESSKDDYALPLSFVDGINLFKQVEINYSLLLKLYQSGLIRGTGAFINNDSRAFGFRQLKIKADGSGYYVYDIANGDKDTNLKNFIIQLFKLFDSNIDVDFDNGFTFGDLDTSLTDFVTIDSVNIRRIHSNLFGRYVVLDKTAGIPAEMKNGDTILGNETQDLNYNKADRFKIIYESENHKVFFHDWDGNPDDNPGLLFHKGIEFTNIGELLLVLAKNLFSYFGFENHKTVFFKHKRDTVLPSRLENILSAKKELTIDKAEGVKILDWYTGNYGTDGSITALNENKLISYKIPLNAFRTDNGYEYRLNYYTNNQEKKVIYFYDTKLRYKDIPQEVISRAEWEQFRIFRDKYRLELDGVNFSFNQNYNFSYENYNATIRPLTIEKNYNEDSTIMTGVEIG